MIYLIHAVEETKIGLDISLRLEEAGFTTYLRQEEDAGKNIEALKASKAVILIISPHSLLSFGSFQSELQLLKQSKASLLPLLYGMSRAEFETKQTEWKSVIGTSATAQIDDATIGSIIPKLVTALKGLGEIANQQIDVQKISRMHAQLSALEKGVHQTGAAREQQNAATTPTKKFIPAVRAVVGIVVVALAAFWYFQTVPAAVEERIILRLHGSNTIGAVLAPALVDGFVKKLGGEHAQWKNGSTPLERKNVFLLKDSNATFAIEVSAHGSSYSFRDLGSKSCDVGMSSRQIKHQEAVVLNGMGLGDMLSPSNEHVLALDGLAIIVHPSNPIRALSIEQVAKIFSGEIANWKLLTGTDAVIRLYARDSMSGTAETFHQLVLHRYKINAISPDAKLFEDSNELSREVSNDQNGIGFVSFTYANESKVIAISEDSSNLSLFPNFLTVGREDYPLSRRLYFYTAANPQNDFARKFVNFALSDEGERIVEQNKFVDLSIRMEQNPVPPDNAPVAYRALVKSAKRLSVNFRFQSGKDVLDTKAVVDLERIVAFVKARNFPQLKLIGFSDDEGDARMNIELSLARAQQVEKEFLERGVNILPTNVVGFGKEMPIASNITPEGKRKNRRVEVWIE